MQTFTDLTTERSKLLFAFAKSKGVEDLDMQDLVVKELSEKISMEMKEQPSLNFDQALENVYGRFPITGFAYFISEKQKEIRKYCRKQYNKSLLRFWLSKRILILMLVFSLCFAMAFMVDKWGLLIFLLLILFLFYFGVSLSTRKLIAPFKELKKLYFYRTFHMYFNDGIDNKQDFSTFQRILMWGWVIAFPFNLDISISALFRIIAAVISALMMVSVYHTYAEMPKLINEEIKNQFSHLIRLNETTSQDIV